MPHQAATPYNSTATTTVRIAVARFEFTFSIPTFAISSDTVFDVFTSITHWFFIDKPYETVYL